MAHALIFDSGVGGLSVAAEIRRMLPLLRLSYIADDAFRPYGEKSEAALRARLPRLLSELCLMLDPDIVVIACNTASTTALPAIRDALSVPVVGVVPAIKPAAAKSRTKTIGVLGTPGTVRRKYVDELIHEFASDCHVILQGSVNLVDQAEAKLSGQAVNMDIIRGELSAMFSGRKGMDLDAVVLACTHFPLLREELKASVTQSVFWIDSGEAVAKRVKAVLSSLTDVTRLSPPQQDTAFLIGPNASPARAQAFAKFGFKRVVGLMPDKMPIGKI
ncbi:glutamate racemase [Litorimonas sp. RW-G-Af-16]